MLCWSISMFSVYGLYTLIEEPGTSAVVGELLRAVLGPVDQHLHHHHVGPVVDTLAEGPWLLHQNNNNNVEFIKFFKF